MSSLFFIASPVPFSMLAAWPVSKYGPFLLLLVGFLLGLVNRLLHSCAHRTMFVAGMYGAIFFVFRGFYAIDLFCILLAVTCYFLCRKPVIPPLVFFLLYLGISTPMLFYLLGTDFSRDTIIGILLAKAQFLGRSFIWSWEVGVQKRFLDPRLSDFLEYLFCPFFFLAPNQLYFLPYYRFRDSRKPMTFGSESLKFFNILIWSIASWGLFSYLLGSFFSVWMPAFDSLFGWSLPIKFFAIGFYWLIAMYFHHSAGVGIQVSAARLMGYLLEVDMHCPFLSRSPLEYFRRHHYFVREYALNIFYRPILIWLLRANISRRWAEIASGTLTYFLIAFPTWGWRENEGNKSLGIGIVICLSILFYLLFSSFFLRTPQHLDLEKRDPEKRSLLTEIQELKKWRVGDYASLALTIFLLSSAKGLIAWFSSRGL